jgi:hypothetical protein
VELKKNFRESKKREEVLRDKSRAQSGILDASEKKINGGQKNRLGSTISGDGAQSSRSKKLQGASQLPDLLNL